MNKPVIIIGAKSIGKVVYDCLENNEVTIYCFLDDDESLHDTSIGTVTVMGSFENEAMVSLIGPTCDVIVASDDNVYRKKINEELINEHKAMPMNVIHKEAYIGELTTLGHGNIICSKATINAATEIGNHVIIGSNVVIDYDSKIDDYVNIGASATIGSNVEVQENTFIGSGAIIVSGINIGKNARIGAGSVVIEDVMDGQTVFGNPAKSI